jgi:hypothetical protein
VVPQRRFFPRRRSSFEAERMSLDVYLHGAKREKVATASLQGRIFIRENGQNREITRDEWDERFPIGPDCPDCFPARCSKCGNPAHEPGAWVPAEVRVMGVPTGPQGFWCDSVPASRQDG